MRHIYLRSDLCIIQQNHTNGTIKILLTFLLYVLSLNKHSHTHIGTHTNDEFTDLRCCCRCVLNNFVRVCSKLTIKSHLSLILELTLLLGHIDIIYI